MHVLASAQNTLNQSAILCSIVEETSLCGPKVFTIQRTLLTQGQTYLRCISKDVSNQFHRELRWVDVSVSDHELLQNVILDGPLELALGHSLWTEACIKDVILDSPLELAL